MIKIRDWSQLWKLRFGAEKSRDLIFTNKTYTDIPPVYFDHEPIKRVTQHKHLGVILTSSLTFDAHLHYVCLRANGKLAVLRSVKGLQRKTLDILYKLTVRSVIDYAMTVYYGTLSESGKNRLSQIQYRAAKVVSGALHLSSAKKLFIDLGWETLKERHDFLGLTLFHKIRNNLTRPLVRQCMPISNTNTQYQLRNSPPYRQFKYHNKKFNDSFFPYFTRKFCGLKPSIRCQRDLDEFKVSLKSFIKPKRHKFFAFGSKRGCALATQLRVGRTKLNAQSYAIGLSTSSICDCLHPSESTSHHLNNCFLYNTERQTLNGKVQQLIPNFVSLSDSKKTDILLFGVSPNDPDFYHTNIKIQLALQQYLLKTKRFDKL